jgi:hypothetical protein
MLHVDDNLDEVLAGLHELDDQLHQGLVGVVERAVVAGAEEAKTNHRFRSRADDEDGIVEHTRGYLVAKGPPDVIGELDSVSNHSAFVNDGTKPHVIEPKYAKALRFEAWGDEVFTANVHHPGTAPDPFFDHGVVKAEQVLMDEAKELLERIKAGSGG